MSRSESSAPAGRVPYSGLWLDDFSLVPVPGGALLAGGGTWQRDGLGAVPQVSDGVAFWDSTTQDWLELPPLPHPRQSHAAVALPDGRVMLIGGRDLQVPELGSTLLWEPGTQRFREGPPLLKARSHPIAVALADGAVLVLGSDFDDDLERGTRVELLRPEASTWELAGQTVRIFHPGPVCVSGNRVVIAGGRDNGFGFAIVDGVHHAPPLDQMTELWDRDTRAWKMAGALTQSRDGALGVTLKDGRVLVVGGWDKGQVLATAEVWNPRTESWSPAGELALPRSGFALTALSDGRAAVSGGLVDSALGSAETETVELWDPTRGQWSPGPSFARSRSGHQLVEVGAGTFLVVGNTRLPDGGLETTWETWRPG
ncbi:kelch repeat-containing protein [Vitiosangium sp. GDMCC 1.1324]|uniref:Kelch repeat-containing protein n=1 Tax=Vitiosangium sp. (strain GDMCC 1.1324) TaxID=2138576 RepID=UPI000D372383|nr:kelch repeat-containing protein [Vitiosangium sp. GDMCC 1.1324]PTL78635.1 galactose oxidase [Vitiosangium sp. GDMCC 1.1324]